jgi:hypothetical protein
MVSKRCNERLRIWSAGCSTREEPWTVAMALSEAGWFDRAPIEIHSSDANSVAIESARRGVHSENRIRDLSPELRPKYFIPIRVTRKCPKGYVSRPWLGWAQCYYGITGASRKDGRRTSAFAPIVIPTGDDKISNIGSDCIRQGG